MAAVGVQRSRAVGKAHTGHRNRNCSRRQNPLYENGGTKAPPYDMIGEQFDKLEFVFLDPWLFLCYYIG